MVSNSALQEESMGKDLNWYLADPSSSTVEKKQIGEYESDVEGVIHNYGIEMQHENKTEVEGEDDPLTDEEVASGDQGSEEPPLSTVPESLTENNTEVSSHIISSPTNAPIRCVLPVRNNQRKSPIRYSLDIEERRSKYPIANYVSTQNLSKPTQVFTKTLIPCHVPKNVEEALADPKWAQAIQVEMEALQKNNIWRLIPLPKGKMIVGYKWVFSVKYKVNGSIDQHKARLMAKGFTKTFSPMAKLNTIRFLLFVAVNLDWPLLQLDVKNAFLHGDLEEEVYMDIPPGYMPSSRTKVLCKLEWTLYGLKQSPRAWFGRFSSAMRRYDFNQSNADHTLFLKNR